VHKVSPNGCHQSLDYFQRKLNEMPKEDKPNIISQNGHIGQAVNADLKEPE
jgi:hypothetical protein